MLRNEGYRLKRVIICTPKEEYFRVNNLQAHNINEIADRDKAIHQHSMLKFTLKEYGCEVIDVPELRGHPNSVFTRDVSLSTPKGYMKLKMGLDARKGEEEWMSRILDSLGEPCAGEIHEPGKIEGGDILLAGSVAFIGLSDRTNEEGVKQLSTLLRDMDYEVRTTSMYGLFLHLGGAMSIIGPERILCCRGVFPKDFLKGFDIIEVSPYGPSSGNVICLGENEVVANTTENMETIKVLERKRVKVHGIDLSEFRKGAGGPSCLILPIIRENEPISM